MHHIRFPPGLTERIDGWAADQPAPKPTRSEAIRRLVETALDGETPSQSSASLDRQIAEQKAAIAEIPEHPGPSPEAALAKMDKALAENELVEMKNEKTRRKKAARVSK